MKQKTEEQTIKLNLSEILCPRYPDNDRLIFIIRGDKFAFQKLETIVMVAQL